MSKIVIDDFSVSDSQVMRKTRERNTAMAAIERLMALGLSYEMPDQQEKRFEMERRAKLAGERKKAEEKRKRNADAVASYRGVEIIQVKPIVFDHKCTMRGIARAVSHHTGITLRKMFSAKRNREIVRARQIAMFLMREEGFSYPQIGKFLGGRDHTTALHGSRVVQSLIDEGEIDPDIHFPPWRTYAARNAVEAGE